MEHDIYLMDSNEMSEARFRAWILELLDTSPAILAKQMGLEIIKKDV